MLCHMKIDLSARFSAWLTVLSLVLVPAARGAAPLSDAYKVGGFYAGVQAYTFNKDTVFEAIDQTKAAGGKVLELFLWQKLSPDLPNVVVDETLAPEHIALLKVKSDAAKVKLINGYIGSAKFKEIGTNEVALRKVFDFAKKMGFQSLTGEPDESQFDALEKLVKEYDIKFCLHNHRKDEKKPDYKYWDPAYTAKLLQKRDARMGVCLDFGHVARSGIKPLDALKTLKGRVLSVHLKDVASMKPDARDLPFGQGVSDIKGILAELRAQNFKGHLAVEYEHFSDKLVDEVRQCLDYVRVEGGKLQLAATAKAGQVPTGFKYEVLVMGDIPEPVFLNFSPDGRLWFTSRRGYVWAYDLKTEEKKQIAHLTVDFEQTPGQPANERGMHGIEFDPDFLKNGYIYLYYSPIVEGGKFNQISRFTVADNGRGGELVAGSEKMLLRFPSIAGFHQGGAMAYNPKDGKLYVTAGDNNVSGNTAKFFDKPNQAQKLTEMQGKTFRLNLDGSIPKDNPFVNTPGARPEIYTYGHRNPYSLNIDYQTGRVYVGEVGFDRKQDWEEINLLQAGGNYGWPRCEGATNGTYGGPCPIEGALDPWFAYGHEGGASITSGPFYRKNTGKYCFPAEYQNGMFYADYTRGWIRFLQVDAANNRVTNSVPFARNCGKALAMTVGPDGALYIADYAGWFTGSVNDKIGRIIYTGESPATASAKP